MIVYIKMSQSELVYMHKEINTLHNRTLLDFCNTTIVEEITGEQLQYILNSLSDQQRISLSSVLPLSLPITLSLSLYVDENYWRRKCFENHWTLVDYWLCSNSWKNTFITHSVETLIDDFISQKKTFTDVKGRLVCFQSYLHNIKINGYKLNYTNDEFEKLNSKNGDNSIEDFVLQLVSLFPDLEEINFNNFPINCELREWESNAFSDHSYEMFSRTFSELKMLGKLSLIGTQMKTVQFSKLVDGLMSLNTLVELNLSCNLIADCFCVHIANLIEVSHLQTLILSNNNITSTGAKDIASAVGKSVSLHTLCLDRNLIGDDGAINLAQNLVLNSTLLKLNLAYNKISSECSSCFSLLIEHNKILVYLDLAGNYLGKNAGRRISESVQESSTILYVGFQFCGFDEEDEDLIHVHLSQNYQNFCSSSHLKKII